jgi:hypothetical protein
MSGTNSQAMVLELYHWFPNIHHSRKAKRLPIVQAPLQGLLSYLGQFMPGLKCFHDKNNDTCRKGHHYYLG